MKITTAELLTIGTGRLCCPMERVYELCNFMTGDNLFTHQLPRAFRAFQPLILERHPWLKGVDETKCSRENWEQWVAQIELEHPGPHEIEPLPFGAWQPCDPVQEASR